MRIIYKVRIWNRGILEVRWARDGRDGVGCAMGNGGRGGELLRRSGREEGDEGETVEDEVDQG